MVAFILVALGLLAAVVAAGNAASVASCTFEQKQARVNALADYQKGMRAARAAYFRKTKHPKKRAAFVRKQQQRLRALRAAAPCAVPPLPPSSSESCGFELVPNAEALRNRPFLSYPWRGFGLWIRRARYRRAAASRP